MADKIILEYGADLSGLKDAQTEIKKVTALTEELGTEIKATFSEKSLDEAVMSLVQQGKTMDALILKYGDANKALKAMQKELATMAAVGGRGTAEFKELAKATAELQDSIGDTRGEIKKLASDTRVFDTIAQGARGITAAFTVATGVTAIFGKENEDLQKSLLKVQGALATLQGVQELANLATEKGGIATVAYGFALKGVEAISKTFGISMAASWAVATAGISIAVTALVALYVALKDATDATDDLKQAEQERAKANELYAETQKNISKEQQIVDQTRRDSAKNDKELALVNIDILKRQIESEQERQRQLGNVLVTFSEVERQTKEYQGIYGEYLSAQAREVQLSKELQKEQERLNGLRREQQKIIEAPEAFRLKDKPKQLEVTSLDIKPTDIKLDTSGMTKMPEIAVPITIQPLSADLAAQKFIADTTEALQAIQPIANAFGELLSGIWRQETQTINEETDKQLQLLEERKNAELQAVGDNAIKRKQIEDKFQREKQKIERESAIKRAEIAREEAITNKILGIFNVITNTAVAVTKALPNYALAAAVAVTGALQAALIASQPLPAIPKFEKGGAVPLLGGNIRTDGGIIGRSHRQGGVLIEAEGGEYITNKIASQKYADELKAANNFRLEDLILHKYVAPALKAANAAYAESYDDRMLRRTIERTSERNAQTISKAVGQAVSESNYFKSRYGV
jgi:hypothetical protein